MELHEALSSYRELFLFELDGNRILFRPLAWQDYKNFAHLFRSYPELYSDLEDLVWDAAVIEHNLPSSKDYADAGLVGSIAQLVLFHSGIGDRSEQDISRMNEELHLARIKTKSVEGQIKRSICEAFPSYRPEELDKLTWSQLMELLAYSESLLGKDFEFSVKGDKPADDSHKVFDMLDSYSVGAGSGVLDQDIGEIDRPGRRQPPKREPRK